MENANISNEKNITKIFIIITMIFIILMFTFLILIILNQYNIINVSKLISNLSSVLLLIV